jgi:hypothetical protein
MKHSSQLFLEELNWAAQPFIVSDMSMALLVIIKTKCERMAAKVSLAPTVVELLFVKNKAAEVPFTVQTAKSRYRLAVW